MIKRLTKVAMAALLIGAVTMFAACSTSASSGGDDDNKKTSKDDPVENYVFAGTTWEYKDVSVVVTITFDSSTFTLKEVRSTSTLEDNGTYTVKGNTATLTFDDDETETSDFVVNAKAGTATFYDKTYTKKTGEPPVVNYVFAGTTWDAQGSNDIIYTYIFNADGTFKSLAYQYDFLSYEKTGTYTVKGYTATLTFDGQTESYEFVVDPETETVKQSGNTFTKRQASYFDSTYVYKNDTIAFYFIPTGKVYGFITDEDSVLIFTGSYGITDNQLTAHLFDDNNTTIYFGGAKTNNKWEFWNSGDENTTWTLTETTYFDEDLSFGRTGTTTFTTNGQLQDNSGRNGRNIANGIYSLTEDKNSLSGYIKYKSDNSIHYYEGIFEEGGWNVRSYVPGTGWNDWLSVYTEE